MSDVRHTFVDLEHGTDAETVGVRVTLVEGGVGLTGPAGADGNTISAASGAPSGSANVGDLYVDTATGNLYRFS